LNFLDTFPGVAALRELRQLGHRGKGEIATLRRFAPPRDLLQST
jgi:hypothetical protein